MNNKPNRREFDRFPMEFVLEVSAKDNERKQFNEKTVLKDVSGGGARFITQRAGKYFPGQLLKMTIYLPGTDDMKALMRGKATVVRIVPPSSSGTGERSRETGIAVKFEAPLHFERVDMRMQGNRR